MNIFKFDLFSSPFFFHIGDSKQKRSSKFGVFLSLVIVVASLTYFIYLSKQYFYNQISPKFRQQTYISEQVDIPLQEDLFAFRYEYNTNQNIEDLEAQHNKTYIMNYALFNYQNNSQTNLTVLKIIKCSNPELQGYNCIDYTSLQNKTMSLNNKKSLLSQIILLTYGCYSQDSFKKDVPSNCASQTDVLNIVNGQRAGLRLKFLTSQYNTTTQKEQISFKNQFVFLRQGQEILNTVSTSTQVTTVSEGLLVLSQMQFSSPFQISLQTQSYSTTSPQKPFSEVAIQADEIVYSIDIQYPIFPEILALVNSTFALLMTLGIFARFFTQKFIKQDFFLLYLQNMYQDSLEQLLKSNKLIDDNQVVYLEKKIKEYEVAQENTTEKSNMEDQSRSILVKLQQNIQQSNDQSEKSLQTEEIYNQTAPDEIKETLQNNSPLNQNRGSIYIPKKDFSIQRKESYKDSFQIRLKDQSLFANKKSFSYRNKAQSKIELTIGIQQKQNKANPLNVDSKILEQDDRTLGLGQLEQSKIIEYYSQKLRATQDKKILFKAQQMILGEKSWKNTNSDTITKEVCKQTRKAIEEQMNKNLDILELYKDIIFLKKAALILLSKEQLAAIKLIGCSTFYLNKLNKADDQQTKNQKRMSYFEKQLDILSSESLQAKYISKFLTDCQKSENLGDIDFRIISSIIKPN